MRTLVLTLALLLLCGSTPLYADEGTNPADDTTNSTIDDLMLGEYWFGAKIEDEDLQGKVVLFEIWGS